MKCSYELRKIRPLLKPNKLFKTLLGLAGKDENGATFSEFIKS